MWKLKDFCGREVNQWLDGSACSDAVQKSWSGLKKRSMTPGL
jgi:hypothetical protein